MGSRSFLCRKQTTRNSTEFSANQYLRKHHVSWLEGWIVGRTVDWLVGWLDILVVRLVGWSVGRLVGL